MKDVWGEAVLFNVIVSEQEMTFEKQYIDNNRTKFLYTLTNYSKSNIWSGNYQNKDSGMKGPVWCVLTSVEKVAVGPFSFYSSCFS